MIAKKKKIFIGTIDIAYQIRDFKKGFESLGYEVITGVQFDSLSRFKQKFDYDYVFSEVKKKWFRGIRPKRLQKYLQNKFNPRKKAIYKIIDECDIFLFMWTSLFVNNADLELLKKKGKKIVVFFVGSDIRYFHSFEQEMKKYGIPSFYNDQMKAEPLRQLESKLSYLRNVEKFADLIYNLPNQGQLALRPYFHFFVPVDTSLIKENTKQREIPVVIHAPSSRASKGTETILATFEQLKRDGLKFDSKLIENTPYEEALLEYTNADILVAELIIPSGGKLDREALAAGTVVLSSINKDYIDLVPDDCPIIHVNPDNLYDQLKSLIIDYPRRVSLARMGRPYVEKYHSINFIPGLILERLNINEKDLKYDYYPDFYLNEYVPESENIELHNDWIKVVKNCIWYKEHIKSGIRDSLDF